MKTGRVVNVLAAGAIAASATTALRRTGVDRVERSIVLVPVAPLVAVPPGPSAPSGASTGTLDVQALEVALSETRADLAHDLVEWLAFERHPVAALLEADELGELAPWLRPADVTRLLQLARNDALEGRRRAAFVALGHVRPANAAHVQALLGAFASRPSEESRLGLIEALVALRHAGAPVDDSLELALGARSTLEPSSVATTVELATRSERP